jgi:23S rRNA (uracil1939-C5)-methyltransferase
MTEKFPKISGIIQNINPEFGNRILGNDEKIIYGKSSITEQIGNKKYRIDYNSFFQVNLEITKKIYDFVAENVSENSKVIDAFSGVGSIGIYLSGKANKLYLIENNPEACKNAEQNLKLNNITNGFVINGNTHQEIEKILQEEEIDTIIFDPPRKGLEKRTVEILLENTVDRIIYVSCDPATQVRDLLLLQKKYEIVKVKAFDMFPQTFHIETLAILQCKK